MPNSAKQMNQPRKPAFRALLTAAAAAIAALFALAACSTDAAPKSCVDAAEEAGVPSAVVDFMRKPPGDLNPVERIAVRQALESFGLGDACAALRAAVDSSGIAAPAAAAADAENAADAPASIPGAGIIQSAAETISNLRPDDDGDEEPNADKSDADEAPSNGETQPAQQPPPPTQTPAANRQPAQETAVETCVSSLEYAGVSGVLIEKLRDTNPNSLSNQRREEWRELLGGYGQRILNACYPYWSEARDSREYCAYALEERGVSFVIIEKLEETDPASLTDEDRVEWLQIFNDYDSSLRGVCYAYWSEDINAANESKRNERYYDSCVSRLSDRNRDRLGDEFGHRAFPSAAAEDILALMDAPYSRLSRDARIALRLALYDPNYGGEECQYYYPQLFYGRWVPLDDN